MVKNLGFLRNILPKTSLHHKSITQLTAPDPAAAEEISGVMRSGILEAYGRVRDKSGNGKSWTIRGYVDLVDFEIVRSIALALPGVEEKPWFGTPGFRIGKTFFARLREEDVLVVKLGFEYRDILIQSDPRTYFITDHYAGWPGVLIRLSRVSAEDLEDAFEQAWRLAAPAKLVAEFDKK